MLNIALIITINCYCKAQAHLRLVSWGVTWAQFWSSLFLQTNMEGSYWCRNMLRDFTVQPAAGGSPAGKAYTHQFPEHVSFYLCILIERVYSMSPLWSLAWQILQWTRTSWWSPVSNAQSPRSGVIHKHMHTHTHIYTQQTSTESWALVQNREAVHIGERTHNTKSYTIHSDILVSPTR